MAFAIGLRKRSSRPKTDTKAAPPVSILRTGAFFAKNEYARHRRRAQSPATTHTELSGEDASSFYGDSHLVRSPSTSSLEQGSVKSYSYASQHRQRRSLLNSDSEYDRGFSPATSLEYERSESKNAALLEDEEQPEYFLQWSESDRCWKPRLTHVKRVSMASSAGQSVVHYDQPVEHVRPHVTIEDEVVDEYEDEEEEPEEEDDFGGQLVNHASLASLHASEDGNRSLHPSIIAYQQYLEKSILQADTRSVVDLRDETDGDSGWLTPASLGSVENWDGLVPARRISTSDEDDWADDMSDISGLSSGSEGYVTCDDGYTTADEDEDLIAIAAKHLGATPSLLDRLEKLAESRVTLNLTFTEDDTDEIDIFIDPIARERELTEAIYASMVGMPPYIVSMTHSRTNTNSSHSLEPEEDIDQDTAGIRILRGPSLDDERWEEERIRVQANRQSMPLQAFADELHQALSKSRNGHRISTTSGGIGYQYKPERSHTRQLRRLASKLKKIARKFKITIRELFKRILLILNLD